MNTHSRKLPRQAVVALLVLSTLALRSASAQSARAGHAKGDAAIIALVPDNVIPAGTVKLVRDYRRGRANIVYLRQSGASSGLLQSAMRALVIAQLEFPNKPNQVSVASMTLEAGVSSDSATRALFADLLKAPSRSVGDAGRVPAVVVSLPDEVDLKSKFKGKYKVKADSART